MGFTGLARWTNAPTTGLESITQNIYRNHHGQYRGKWQLSVKSFRSMFGAIPGLQIPAERSMCTLTMNENVFVLLEDPMAPPRAEFMEQSADTAQGTLSAPLPVPPPTHYRQTYVTVSPPGSHEQLLSQLRARWTSVRQSGASGGSQRSQGTGQQLTIDGHVFAIGNDWLVRAGNVMLAGGTVKGMLLEAEYLPLPALRTPTTDGTSELLSNLLTSVLPNIPDASTVAVTISDAQWDEVRWDRDEEEQMESNDRDAAGITDDIFAHGEEDIPTFRKGDWIGIDRDRRSAYLIMGALKSEGIL